MNSGGSIGSRYCCYVGDGVRVVIKLVRIRRLRIWCNCLLF